MATSSYQVPFLAHNSTVKAWCVTHLKHDGTTNSMTQADFDTLNFLDGYNLRLDVGTRNNFTLASTLSLFDGAVYFSFLTPMPHKKYKVFAKFGSAYSNTIENTLPHFSYVLDSSSYPKTTDGFWLRCGITDTTNSVQSARLFPFNSVLKVVVL